MNASKTIADHIKRCALRELQNADELGGPEFPEYVALMQEVAAECTKRAETARNTQRENRRGHVLAWVQRNVNEPAEIWETGGGCTAIGVSFANNSDAHWLITENASGDAPESLTGSVLLGFYRRSQEDWLTFDCRDVPQAVGIINLANGHS
jgi:hypothetical protein